MPVPENAVQTLPPLSAEEDNFCLGIIEYGGNVGAAYRAAFGKKVSNPAAKGRELINRPEIALRIKKLAEATEEHALISLGSHFMQLARIRDLSIKQGDMKTGLQAEVKRGELAGYYKKQEEANETDGKTFVQINFNGPTGSASPQEWAEKFGKTPIVIDNGA